MWRKIEHRNRDDLQSCHQFIFSTKEEMEIERSELISLGWKEQYEDQSK